MGTIQFKESERQSEGRRKQEVRGALGISFDHPLRAAQSLRYTGDLQRSTLFKRPPRYRARFSRDVVDAISGHISGSSGFGSRIRLL